MKNSTSLSGEVDKGETSTSIIIVIHLLKIDAILAQAVASAEIFLEKLRVANTLLCDRSLRPSKVHLSFLSTGI